MKKKLTKILAITLAFVMTSLSVNAAVYNDIAYPWIDDVYRLDIGLSGSGEVSETGDDANEIESALCMLGIMTRNADGRFEPNAKLTRAAYEAAIRVIYTGGDAVDFSEYEATYAGKTVKQQEIVAKLLSFIESAGIDQNTEDIAGYAAAAGITKGIEYEEAKEMTRGEFATAVWNTLNSPYVHISYADGHFQLDAKEGATLLQDKLGVYEIKGKLNAIPGLNLYGVVSPKEGVVEIDRVQYKYGDLADVVELFGYDVKGWAKYDKDTNEYNILSLVKSTKDETIEVSLRDIENIDTGYFYYEEEGKSKKVKLDEFKYIMYNGDFVNAIDETMLDEGGIITLTKSGKDVNYDIAVIKEYDNFMMTTFFTDTMTAFLAYTATYNGELSIDLDIDTNLYVYLDGKRMTEYDKLGKNRAMSIIQNASKSYTELRISTNSVTGKVTGESDDGWLVEGEDLLLDTNYVVLAQNTLSGAKEITNGVSGTFYYTENGVISGYTAEATTEYALIKRAWYDDEKSETIAKMFTQDNEWIMAEFTDTVTLDGVRGVKNENIAPQIMTAKGSEPVAIVRIKRNADGDVKFIDTITDTAAEVSENDPERLKQIVDFNGGMPWVGGWYVHGTQYHVPDKTPMFMIPDDPELDSGYAFVTASALPRDTESNPQAKYKAYTADSWNMASVAVRYGNTIAASNRDNYWYVYIRGVKNVYDPVEQETEEVLDCYQLTRGVTEIAAKTYDLPNNWQSTFGLTANDLKGTFTGITLIDGEVTGFMNGTYPHIQANHVVNANSLAGSSHADGLFFWANSTGNLNYLAGKVVEVDTLNKFIKVDTGDGVIRTAMFAVYTIASTDYDDPKYEAEGITVEQINPGDFIYWYGSLYRAYCAMVIKNFPWS